MELSKEEQLEMLKILEKLEEGIEQAEVCTIYIKLR